MLYKLELQVNSAAQAAEFEVKFDRIRPFLKFEGHDTVTVKIEEDDGDYPPGTLCLLFDKFDDLSICPNEDFHCIGRDGGAWVVVYQDQTYLMEKHP